MMDGDEAGRRAVGATATARDRWSHTRSPRLYDTIGTNESANTCRDSPQRGMVRWLETPRELWADDDAGTTQKKKRQSQFINRFRFLDLHLLTIELLIL